MLCAVSLLLAPQARAGENDIFGVTPSPLRVDGEARRVFTIPLDRGTTHEDAVRIYNRSAEQITLNVYAAEAVSNDEGVVAVGFRRDRPPGLAAWIEVSEQVVRLGPGEEIVVPWRIRLGGGSPDPEMAAIVVESATPGEGALDIVQRIAILVRPAEAGAATGSVPVDDGETRWPWWPWIVVGASVAAAAAVLTIGRREGGTEEADEAEQVEEDPELADVLFGPGG